MLVAIVDSVDVIAMDVMKYAAGYEIAAFAGGAFVVSATDGVPVTAALLDDESLVAYAVAIVSDVQMATDDAITADDASQEDDEAVRVAAEYAEDGAGPRGWDDVTALRQVIVANVIAERIAKKDETEDDEEDNARKTADSAIDETAG